MDISAARWEQADEIEEGVKGLKPELSPADLALRLETFLRTIFESSKESVETTQRFVSDKKDWNPTTVVTDIGTHFLTLSASARDIGKFLKSYPGRNDPRFGEFFTFAERYSHELHGSLGASADFDFGFQLTALEERGGIIRHRGHFSQLFPSKANTHQDF
jgi:hypothetical protein